LALSKSPVDPHKCVTWVKNGRVRLPRNKTGVGRDFPLWSETVKALKELPRSGELVFYTSRQQPWVTTVINTNGDGEREYMSINRITPTFSRLMKKVRLHVPKGTGLSALCRTAATMSARSRDPFAVQRLLGHVDLTMATRYVQDVSEQSDRVIENSRRHVLGLDGIT
jgi:integrase